MKKLTIFFIISFLFVSMLLSGSDINKLEQEKLFQQRNSLNAEHIGSNSTPSRDAGDILFQFNPPMNPWGIGYDCEFLWLSDAIAADPNIHQYTTDGTATGATINCSSWMGSWVGDMANTPGFIFIVNVGGDNNIYKIDEVTGDVEEIIAGAWNFVSARGLAYDPDANEFYIGGWNHAEIYHIDATGATIGTFPFASVSGLAWHPMGNNGAGTLFVAENATGNNIYEVDPTSGAIIQQFTSPGAAYAGAGLTLDSAGNLWAIDQGTNTVYNIDSGIPMGEPGAPAAPTDFAIVPDPGGALSADLSWVCPTLTIDGSALTELDEMQLYRGEDLIYTDTNPTIGGAGSYTDVVPASGNYSYSVLGVNSQGDGIPASIGSWIGEDIPNVVTGLLLEDVGGDGYLTWVNPTTGLNGGAFNEPILGYHLDRSDGIVIEVTGEVTEFTDNTIPTADYYSYIVTPYNSIGDGGSATSNTVWIGDAFSGIVILDLDPTPTGTTLQASLESLYYGSVVLTSDINAYPLTSEVDALFILLGIYASNAQILIGEETPIVDYINAGGNVYMEGGDSWYYDPLYMGSFDFGPLFGITGVADGSGDLFTVNGADFLAGMTWSYSGENSWIDQLVPIAPAVTVFSNPSPSYDCGIAYNSGTYKTVGTSFEITGLGGTNTLDDAVEGICTFFDILVPPVPGFIEGTVEIAEGAGNVEDVEVEAGGVIVNPLADGTYSIELNPGTYDVTASLDGYDTEVIEDILVTEGNATTGVDFSLVTDGDDIIVATTMLKGNYPNPFNPVTNIAYSIQDAGNVTIEVYNLKGQLVKSLVNEVIETGDHIITWNGRDNSNKSVASGVYFYKMKAQNYSSIKKMILMK